MSSGSVTVKAKRQANPPREAKPKKEKEEKAAAQKVAKQGSEEIADTPHHRVIRPLTAEASCYYGKSTKWCISAERSSNYFDQYTSEGKAFLFLLAKRKNIEPAYKKIAVVLKSIAIV